MSGTTMTGTAGKSAAGYAAQLRVAAAPEVVFDALTTVTGLAGWWSPVTGSGAAGGELRFRHSHVDPLVIAVDTADRPHAVVWRVLDYPLNPEWTGTRITFALEPDADGGTVVDFRHEGLTPQLECYEQCRRGWDQVLPSLRAYVDTGTGTPFAARPPEARMTPTIEQEIVIDAPVEAVWRAVTEPEQIRVWFADEVDLAATPGYTGSLTFTGQATNKPMTVQVTVQTVTPHRSFSYRWQHPEGAEADEGNSALVEFTLVPERGRTRLRVVESGIESMGRSADQQESYRREHTEGWAVHLDRLRGYLLAQPAPRA